jgi:hypothetical protein
MTLSLRLSRGETPGWIYSPSTPGFFFTGGYCCKVATAKYTVLGGVRQGAIPIANAEQYFEESWSVIAPVPSPARSQAAGTSYRGAGLHIGGTFTSPPYFSAQVDRLWQGTWNAETSLPEPRHAHGAVTVDDAVYVVCGRNQQQQTVNTNLEYKNQTWTLRQSQSTLGRSFANVCQITQGYLSCGGLSPNLEVLQDCQTYKPISDTWTIIQSPPSGGRFAAAMGATRTKVILAFGSQGNGLLASSVNLFENDSWQIGQSSPNQPRSYLAYGVCGGDLMFCGGLPSSGFPTSLNESLAFDSWSTRAPCLPPNRWLHSATSC